MIEKTEKLKIEVDKNFIYIKKYIELKDGRCGCKDKITIYQEQYVCTNQVYLDMLNSEDTTIQHMVANILFNITDVPILDNGTKKYKYIA